MVNIADPEYQENWKAWCREHDAKAMLLGVKYGAMSHALFSVDDVSRRNGKIRDADTLEPITGEEYNHRFRVNYGIQLFREKHGYVK